MDSIALWESFPFQIPGIFCFIGRLVAKYFLILRIYHRYCDKFGNLKVWDRVYNIMFGGVYYETLITLLYRLPSHIFNKKKLCFNLIAIVLGGFAFTLSGAYFFICICVTPCFQPQCHIVSPASAVWAIWIKCLAQGHKSATLTKVRTWDPTIQIPMALPTELR